jgi:signal peptidase II
MCRYNPAMTHPAPANPSKLSTATAPHQDAESRPPVCRPGGAGHRPAAVALFLLVALVAFSADLGLKSYAFNHVADLPVVLDASAGPTYGVPHHQPVVLLPRVLNLQLTANAGAIFGMGKGSRWIFVAVSIVAAVFIGRVFWTSPAKATAMHLGLGLILAGAMGNLYDRLIFALVRDMLHLFPGVELPFGLSWPGGMRDVYPWIFNLADVALLTGVVLVVWVTWRCAGQPPSTDKTGQD